MSEMQTVNAQKHTMNGQGPYTKRLWEAVDELLKLWDINHGFLNEIDELPDNAQVRGVYQRALELARQTKSDRRPPGSAPNPRAPAKVVLAKAARPPEPRQPSPSDATSSTSNRPLAKRSAPAPKPAGKRKRSPDQSEKTGTQAAGSRKRILSKTTTGRMGYVAIR